MKHLLYIIIALLFLGSCGTTKSQGTTSTPIKNSDSTPPPEGFVPLAPPVVRESVP